MRGCVTWPALTKSSVCGLVLNFQYRVAHRKARKRYLRLTVTFAVKGAASGRRAAVRRAVVAQGPDRPRAGPGEIIQMPVEDRDTEIRARE